MKLNYFKGFDSLKKDFNSLSLKDQSQELHELMNHYSSFAKDDIRICGELTAQTKKTKELYDILRFEHEKNIDK